MDRSDENDIAEELDEIDVDETESRNESDESEDGSDESEESEPEDGIDSTATLEDFFQFELKPDLQFLNLKNQRKLTNDHLKILANNCNSSGITRINLKYCEKISYKGIVELWKSPFLGRLRDEEPLYDRRSNRNIVTVKVEIGHTKAAAQYEPYLALRGKRIFPLPFKDKFDIYYYDSSWDCIIRKKVKNGLKKLVITDHGKVVGIKQKEKI